jgi:hypothetical protein
MRVTNDIPRGRPLATVNYVTTLKDQRLDARTGAATNRNHELCHTPLHGLKAHRLDALTGTTGTRCIHLATGSPLPIGQSVGVYGARFHYGICCVRVSTIGSSWKAVYGARCSTEWTLEDAIGSHACWLEANMRVTNGIPLGCSSSYRLAL